MSDKRWVWSLMVICLFVWYKQHGSILTDPNYPIDAPGVHCIIYQKYGDNDPNITDVLGAQEIEDAIEAAPKDGDHPNIYRVYWEGQKNILPEHQAAIDAMKTSGGPPQWCVASSLTGRYVTGIPPDDLDVALKAIEQVTNK